jgi:hypothetical protein
VALRIVPHQNDVDGVTEDELVLEPGPLTPAEQQTLVAALEETCRRWTFEGSIGEIERFWRTVLPDWQPVRLLQPGERPSSIVYRSREWYAADILGSIAWLRRVTVEQQHPLTVEQQHHALVVACRVGRVHEEAVRRFGYGDDIRRSRKRRAANRANAAKAVAKRRAQMPGDDESLLAEVQRIRRRHPTWKRRTIAGFAPLLRKFGRKSGDRWRAINALAKRIAGLEKKRD